jgi:hypothetical protein
MFVYSRIEPKVQKAVNSDDLLCEFNLRFACKETAEIPIMIFNPQFERLL